MPSNDKYAIFKASTTANTDAVTTTAATTASAINTIRYSTGTVTAGAGGTTGSVYPSLKSIIEEEDRKVMEWINTILEKTAVKPETSALDSRVSHSADYDTTGRRGDLSRRCRYCGYTALEHDGITEQLYMSCDLESCPSNPHLMCQQFDPQ